MTDNIIDALFDENNRENIILYGENEEAVEFEQIFFWENILISDTAWNFLFFN